ncbi:MAG TPA: hypothetical protein VGE97_08495 [Nitrososphaera sp.]
MSIDDLQRNMHKVQGSKAAIVCGWSLWYRPEKMPDMWLVYQMEWDLVPLLPL